MKAQPKKIRVQETSGGMSLVTPNGRFSMSYSGERASGYLAHASQSKAFHALINFVNAESVKEGMNNGKAFAMLADEKLLTTLWPEWNKSTENPFKSGQRVQMSMEKYRAKYGLGTIAETKGKDVIVVWDSGRRVQMSFDLIALA